MPCRNHKSGSMTLKCTHENGWEIIKECNSFRSAVEDVTLNYIGYVNFYHSFPSLLNDSIPEDVQFSVDDLPNGYEIDPETGVIFGVCIETFDSTVYVFVDSENNYTIPIKIILNCIVIFYIVAYCEASQPFEKNVCSNTTRVNQTCSLGVGMDYAYCICQFPLTYTNYTTNCPSNIIISVKNRL